MTRSTHTPAVRSALAVLAASALAFTLASCSGDGDADASPSAGETSESASAEATDAASESAEPSAEETTATESAAPPAAGGDVAACMLGDWEMDTEAMKAQIEETLGGMATDMQVGGTSYATITPTTIDSVVDSTSSFTMDLGEAGKATGETVTKGTVSIAYTLAGDVLTYGDIVSADGTITSTVTMPGAEPTTQEVPMDQANAGSTGLTATITCDDSTLVMTSAAGEVSISQTFNRR